MINAIPVGDRQRWRAGWIHRGVARGDEGRDPPMVSADIRCGRRGGHRNPSGGRQFLITCKHQVMSNRVNTCFHSAWGWTATPSALCVLCVIRSESATGAPSAYLTFSIWTWEMVQGWRWDKHPPVCSVFASSSRISKIVGFLFCGYPGQNRFEYRDCSWLDGNSYIHPPRSRGQKSRKRLITSWIISKRLQYSLGTTPMRCTCIQQNSHCRWKTRDDSLILGFAAPAFLSI